jgi:hypothetical protein
MRTGIAPIPDDLIGSAAVWKTFYDYIIFEQKKPLKYSFRGLGITKALKIFKI